MAKYAVTIEETVRYYVYGIEADTEDEAKEKVAAAMQRDDWEDPRHSTVVGSSVVRAEAET